MHVFHCFSLEEDDLVCSPQLPSYIMFSIVNSKDYLSISPFDDWNKVYETFPSNENETIQCTSKSNSPF